MLYYTQIGSEEAQYLWAKVENQRWVAKPGGFLGRKSDENLDLSPSGVDSKDFRVSLPPGN